MPISSKLDSQLVEKIIIRAKGYTRMANAYTIDAAFGKAVTEFLGDKNPQWGKYVKTSKEIFLSRKNESKEAKWNELLEGARQAEFAHEALQEAEESADRTAELREQYKKTHK